MAQDPEAVEQGHRKQVEDQCRHLQEREEGKGWPEIEVLLGDPSSPITPKRPADEDAKAERAQRPCRRRDDLPTATAQRTWTDIDGPARKPKAAHEQKQHGQHKAEDRVRILEWIERQVPYRANRGIAA